MIIYYSDSSLAWPWPPTQTETQIGATEILNNFQHFNVLLLYVCDARIFPKLGLLTLGGPVECQPVNATQCSVSPRILAWLNIAIFYTIFRKR